MNEADSFLLPLFPLNVVLYPGMFLPLHVFEERYKTMVNDCLNGRKSFGVVLIADGKAEGDIDVKPYKIGTIAKIVQMQKLDTEGQMNIWIVGDTRFEILDYPPSPTDYLVGRVHQLRDIQNDPVYYMQVMNEIEELFREYVELVVTLNDSEREDVDYELATDPSLFSSQVASMLNITLAEKQRLLEMDDVNARLNYEATILNREIAHLKEILKNQSGPKTQDLPWGGEIYLN